MSAELGFYGGVLAVALAESLAFVGMVVPGFGLLVAAGAVARAGRADLFGVIAAAAVGALLGDLASYAVGRWCGTWPPVERRMARHLASVERAQAIMRRWGMLAVIAGRFLGPTRGVAALAAGLTTMPLWRFAIATVVGAAAWAWFAVGLGHIAGVAVEEVPWIAAAIAVAALTAWWLIRRRRPRDEARSASGTGE